MDARKLLKKSPMDVHSLLRYMDELNEDQLELMTLRQRWDVLSVMGEMIGARTDITQTRADFADLTEKLVFASAKAKMGSVEKSLSNQAQVVVDIIIRNLFERTADVGFLSTDGDIRSFLRSFKHSQKVSEKEVETLRQRFNEYVKKYSVYEDVLLFSTDGRLLCSLSGREQKKELRLDEPLFHEAIQSKAGFCESFVKTELSPEKDKALVYSYKVTEANDPSCVIGVLCLVFRFDDEMKMIFEQLVSDDSWTVVGLIDSEGRVISSSDTSQLPLGFEFKSDSHGVCQLMRVGGRMYMATIQKTQGYQGFFGLGWSGVALIPVDQAFNKGDRQDSESLSEEIIRVSISNKRLFSDEIRQIPVNAQRIQSALDRTVWNGALRSTGDAENSFLENGERVLLREISATGTKTRSVFDRSIGNLNRTSIETLFNEVSFYSQLAIDIMDRNLYERANDCRWWALDSVFREKLSATSLNETDIEQCAGILQYINSLYTVYTNIFLFDSSGRVLCMSNDSDRSLIGQRIEDPWLRLCLSQKGFQDYAVSDFVRTPFYSNRPTYIYAASIKSPDDPDRIVGGIGLVFDSEPQFQEMLQDALPKQVDGKTLEGYSGVFVGPGGVVISSTDSRWSPGDKVSLSEDLEMVENANYAKVLALGDCLTLTGVCGSKGYREYKGAEDSYRNQTASLVLKELGQKVVQKEKPNRPCKKSWFSARSGSDDQAVHTFATFYSGEKWFGFSKRSIVECVELEGPRSLPGAAPSVLGTQIYRNSPIMIIDPSRFLGKSNDESWTQIIVVEFEGRLYGLLSPELGEVIHVSSDFICDSKSVVADNSTFVECFIRNPEETSNGSVLTILDPGQMIRQLQGGHRRVA